MKLIKNNQEAYMGWHDGHPIWDDRFVVEGPTTPFYVENISGTNETLEIFNRSLDGGTPPVFDIEISSDGVNWMLWGSTASSPTRTLNPRERLYMRASTNRWYISNVGRVAILGMTKVGGNIMSLLYGSNFTGSETSFPTNDREQFGSLFRNDYTPTNMKLVSAGNLILPATTLTISCYGGMFAGCHHLAQAPILPATTLALSCYQSMFFNCDSLVQAPILPATTLVGTCYYHMFDGCINLNYIKCLATDISAHDCLYNWVDGVAATGTFTKKAGVNYPSGKSGIPEGWTVIEE